MNGKNSNHPYLSLRQILSESLLRDLIMFIFLFLLIIAQGWENILLLLFPLITFTFSLFFRILSSNIAKTKFNNSYVIYNPLGLERKHANRFYFCSVFQLILIFWLGAESLYNPHIVHNYLFFFYVVFIFLYTFSFFWIFIDLWQYTKTEIIVDKHEVGKNLPISKDLRNIISYLAVKEFRMIKYITFFIFIVLNMINLIILFLINYSHMNFLLILPGSQIVPISYVFVGFLIISPTLTMFLLFRNYRTINEINKKKLDKIIEPLPRNLQIKIIENLKLLNNRIQAKLESE
jgi:hypothetical protein